MNKEHKRILIVEVNWIGDVLFSTPLIRAVQAKFKDAHIACMVPPRVKEILEHNPRIDEIIVYDEKAEHRTFFGKLRFINLLRKKHFDLAILLHRSLTRTLITFFAGIKERTGYMTEKRNFFLTSPVKIPEKDLHKVDYFLRIAESLGCDASRKDCEFFVGEKERGYIKKELEKSGVTKRDLLVVINPGGNWRPKRWSEANFALFGDSIIKSHGAKVVISGAPEDMKRAERVRSRMKEKPIIFCGKTNLKELGALMERANFVVSGDSGPMHIARALKSNVVALFGPTSPELTGPYGSGNYKIISKAVGCEVPCYDLACSNQRCMDAITVDDVLRVFGEMHAISINSKH